MLFGFPGGSQGQGAKSLVSAVLATANGIQEGRVWAFFVKKMCDFAVWQGCLQLPRNPPEDNFMFFSYFLLFFVGFDI